MIDPEANARRASQTADVAERRAGRANDGDRNILLELASDYRIYVVGMSAVVAVICAQSVGG